MKKTPTAALVIIGFTVGVLVGWLAGVAEHYWPKDDRNLMVLDVCSIILFGAIFSRAWWTLPVGLTLGYVSAYGPGGYDSAWRTSAVGVSLAIMASPLLFLVVLFFTLLGVVLKRWVLMLVNKPALINEIYGKTEPTSLAWIIVTVMVCLPILVFLVLRSGW